MSSIMYYVIKYKVLSLYKSTILLTYPVFFAIIRLVLPVLWPHRLSVRTSGFHPEKRGSTPLGATKNHSLFSPP